KAVHGVKRRRDGLKAAKKLRGNEAGVRKQLEETRKELEASASQPLDGRVVKLRQLADVVGAGGPLRQSVEAVRNESNSVGVELETSPEEALAALEADVARTLAAADEESRRLADERQAQLKASSDALQEKMQRLAKLQAEQPGGSLDEQQSLLQEIRSGLSS